MIVNSFMSFTRYTRAYNFNQLLLDRKELDSIKQQLQESCYFVLYAGTQFGAKMNYYSDYELKVNIIIIHRMIIYTIMLPMLFVENFLS